MLLLRGGAPTESHPNGRPLAAETIHSTASLLFTCLGDAARLEHIPANPMADRKVKLPKRREAEPGCHGSRCPGSLSFKQPEGRGSTHLS